MAKKTAERGALSRAIRKYLSEHPEASPPVIITALRKQGIKASVSLPASIKYRKPKSAAQRAAERAAKAKPPAPPPPPPNFTGPRSRAIRSYLRKNPEAEAKEIIAALKKQRVTVSAALIAAVKQNDRDLHVALKRAKKSAQERSWRGRRFSASAIVDARKLVKELGGIENAKQALKVLEQLR